MIEPVPASQTAGRVRLHPAAASPPNAGDFAAAYAERVHRFAAMLTRNDQDSVDLAQEALIKALQGLPRFDAAKRTLDTWLWRIVINTAKDAGRLSTRRRLLHERWLRNQAASVAERTVESEVLDRVRDAELLATVRWLPERARTMIALRFGAQLGTGEIAQQLGMTPAAVSMAIGRALLRLRRDLEDMP
jgi:RNA polymerase sigma-70 factor (ECF subfamily)